MNKNCPLIVAIVGFVILFIGIMCAWYVFPKVVEYAIGEQIALVEGNDVYNLWKKQPFPLKFKVYFFNVTNANEVHYGANPILKEMGPYVYDEYWERVNVSINEETDSISYMLQRTFHWNQKDSGCRTESDMITMLNGALVSTALQVYAIMPSAMSMVDDAIPYLYKGAKDVFIRATAKDILFDGILITCHDPEVEMVCGAMKGMLPPTMEFTNNGTDFKFSMFGYMNTTLAGPFEIARGLSKNSTRGDVLSFRGDTEMDVWPGDSCNQINGSDTTLFHPMKKPLDKIYAFSPDICRSMYVSFKEEVVFKGVPTWKYVNDPEAISDPGTDQCFCPRVKDEDYNDVAQCPPKGLVNIGFCVKGPILISNPHFYHGDPSLLKFAAGVKPVKELHENLMYIEPLTGTPLYGVKRLQMNVELKRFEDFTLLANISEGICPMLWLEEGAEVPQKFVDMVSSGLGKLIILDAFKWVFIISGILMMMSSFGLVMYKERLLCFGAVYSVKVGITEVKTKEQKERMGMAEPISTINFNNTTLYPALYPQLEDKNVNDRIVRRSNANLVGVTAWKN